MHDIVLEIVSPQSRILSKGTISHPEYQGVGYANSVALSYRETQMERSFRLQLVLSKCIHIFKTYRALVGHCREKNSKVKKMIKI